MFTSVASREITPRDVIRRRLLLVLFGLGTNIGIKQIAAGEHGETEAVLRRIRWLYINRDSRWTVARSLASTWRWQFTAPRTNVTDGLHIPHW